ncbi:MAG TPA: L,D-transpeptidase family protein [Stellaceae bacterium]|nr:L,D-transpeptidase family protein [Stellaceae bacterium]
MDLVVDAGGTALWGGRHVRCALGRAGVVPARDKREGDGATPAGRWTMREVLFRADRLGEIVTPLACRELAPDDGWCDDPKDPAYNRSVTLPYRAHCEHLWLEDHVYDVIVPLGYNDNPVIPGHGSAIFLHVARPLFTPTAGCIALALPDLLALLREAVPGSAVRVRAD